MLICSKNLSLELLDTDNSAELLPLRNSDSYILNCTRRKYTVSADGLYKELQQDFQRDKHKQALIYKRSNHELIGTVYSYGYSKEDGYLFVTTYISPRYIKRGYGVEAFLLFQVWLTNLISDLRKIYLDVYDFNLTSVEAIKRCGAKLEGQFHEHRFVPNYGYRDLLRFALYSQDWNNGKAAELIQHFEILQKKGGD